MVLAATGNFLIFFAGDIVSRIRTGRRRMAHQASVFAASQDEREARHRCRVCGKTDLTHPQMDFRYCSKCAGNQCYCPEHIFNHEHVLVDEDAKQKRPEPAGRGSFAPDDRRPHAGRTGWRSPSERYARHGVALGQVATGAHDEALYLLLHTLRLPLDSAAPVLARRLTPAEHAAVGSGAAPPHPRPRARGLPHAARRGSATTASTSMSASIIPRSYFLEIIPRLGRLLQEPGRGTRARRRGHRLGLPRHPARPPVSAGAGRRHRHLRRRAGRGADQRATGTASRRRVTLHRSDVFACRPARAATTSSSATRPTSRRPS